MQPKPALPVSLPDAEIVRYYRHAGGLSDALDYVRSQQTEQPETPSIRIQRPRDGFAASDEF